MAILVVIMSKTLIGQLYCRNQLQTCSEGLSFGE